MKIIGTIKKAGDLVDLKKKCKGVLLRHKDMSLRYDVAFSTTELKEVISIAIKFKLTVYVDFTNLFDDESLEKAYKLVLDLQEYNIFYVYSDIGFFMKLSRLNLNKKLIYAPDTYVCNYLDFNFFAKYKIFGTFPSLEIPLTDIAVIGNNKKNKLFYKAFGKTSMFHSKRKLVTLYQENFDLPKIPKKSKLKLVEETRKEEYLIDEKSNGTHIYQSGIRNILPALDTINEVVDFMLLDGMYINQDDYLKVIDIYKDALNDIDHLNLYNQELEKLFDNLSYNFVYEDSVYKKGDF
ncbi:MAG: U32 family peptidase [bacterium]